MHEPANFARKRHRGVHLPASPGYAGFLTASHSGRHAEVLPVRILMSFDSEFIARMQCTARLGRVSS